jgi:hypothetical protein
MLAFRIAAGLIALILLPTVATAQTYHEFGAWSTVCDNLLRCSAFGFASESDSYGYVRVRRDGRPGAQPVVELAVQSDGKPRDRKLTVRVSGGTQRPFTVGPLDAVVDGYVAQAIIPAPVSLIFINALHGARTAEIRLVDHAAADERSTIALADASTALRSMHAQQAGAGVIAAPVIVAHVMHALPTPKAPGPNLVPGADPICSSAPEMWLALGGGVRLRGVCSEGGAYNTAYRFFRVDGGRREPVAFRIPWRAASSDDREVVNPQLSADGLLLSGFAKGIGLGTCGEAADFVWTGHAFRLFHFTEMRTCRGATSDDWPVLYQAKIAR